jgi:SAM-dependent methyltransferase
MKRFDNKKQDILYLIYRWIYPLSRPKNFYFYTKYLTDMIKYSNLEHAEKISIINTYPCLNDNQPSQKVDSHYFYQNLWAFNKIKSMHPTCHIDIGSEINFIGYITVIIPKVIYIDIRPLDVDIQNLIIKNGSILNLPFENNTINSLSCFHVVEHIGLGRYGDPLDPDGSYKAIRELCRVLAKNGNLYFSIPVGKPRLCFNAHRIYSPDHILKLFKTLKLIELSAILDNGHFIKNMDIAKLRENNYSCGLFHFVKE